MDRSNNRKQKEVYNLAHVRVTILVAEERSKPKGDRRTTSQVIAQVVAITVAKSTINKYVAHGSIGLFPIARGYCGMIAPHMFRLLVLAVESKIQIDQVNSGSPECNNIIRTMNKCCGVVDMEGGRPKTTLFERVMRATNLKLSVAVSPLVEERRLRWTMYSNLQMWFVNFWAFLLEKEFAREREGGGGLDLVL